ncbi:50S ribosomal protein L11 methyltransferase [hot springs metagenome]|uniref:50S ribosomal protein L11 methyltransferase n=1 Tax=hot springs metagenome TaxID=433727 RepID=A0A5J4L7I6_9ZZZZ
MGYYEFKISISDESKDALIEYLYSNGCLGIIEGSSNITAYFLDTIGIDKITDFMQSARHLLRESGLNNNLSYDYVFISERDWNESWKKKFKPINIGENLTIVPPWEENNNGRIGLIIDPGMAFGTGHHETTKTCLMIIEKLSKEKNEKNSFLDFGTGTGILAIAALKLGFKHAVCIDIDLLAIDAAQRNVRLNNIKNIEIRQGSIALVNGKFDFIAANLMSEVLIQNAHEIASRLNKSGIVLLSGMITGQENDVIASMKKEGLYVLEKFYDSRWVTTILTH